MKKYKLIVGLVKLYLRKNEFGKINNKKDLDVIRKDIKENNFVYPHGDYDHMGKAVNLVNNFKVEKVIFNYGEFNELEQDLIQVLDKKYPSILALKN